MFMQEHAGKRPFSFTQEQVAGFIALIFVQRRQESTEHVVPECHEAVNHMENVHMH
jgi:hypothetical protein